MSKPNTVSKFKIFRLAIMSRKINAMKWLKYKFGWPKKIPNFRDETIKIVDGKKKAR